MALSKITNASVADTAVHGRRNLIINGAMQVAQRGTSSTFSNGNAGYKVADRWLIGEAGTESFVFDISQSTDAPDGFAYSYKLDCTTADASLSAATQASLEQRIEAQDLQRLNYGTSSAKSLTLSFYVKSSKTGTYIAWFYQDDVLRSISAAYTINSANTWEKKTITIAGDTNGQIDNDNNSGFRVRFTLFAGTDFTSGTLQTSWGSSANDADRYVGQVNLADSTSNSWQITGVQLEVGEATPFEHRSYGEELALCQRYYIKSGNVGTNTEWFAGVATYAGYGGSYAQCIDGNQDRVVSHVKFPVYMRARPTVTYYPARSDSATTSNRLVKYNGTTLTTPTYYPSGDCNGLFGYFSGLSYDYVAFSFQFTADAEL